MAIYESEFEPTPNGLLEKIYLLEEPIYGSSRIGEYKKKTLLKIIDEPTVGLPTESLASLNARITENTNTLIGVQKDMEINHSQGGLSFVTPQAGGRQDINYSTPSTPQVSGVNAQIGFGVQGKNLCVVEDEYGNVVFTAYTAKEIAGGATDVCRVLDANNNLMQIPLGFPIKSNYEGKSLGFKKPGSNDIYYLVTIGKDLRPYYHEINITTKQVSPNHLIDPIGIKYGYGMALIEDNSGVAGTAKLFLRKYLSKGHRVDIVSVPITSAGFGAPSVVQNFPAEDIAGKGEMQISPDGSKLAIAYQKNYLGWLPTEGKIRVYNLDLNHNITGLTVEHDAGYKSVLQSFDFSPSSKNIYFSQQQVGKVAIGGTANTSGIYKLNLATNSSVKIINDISGEVRRAKDNNMYVAVTTEQDLKQISAPDGASTVSTFAVATTPWKTTGAIPLQPHKILHLNQDIITRDLANKTYEINDHLGNVRAVVSDIKQSTIVGGIPQNFEPDIVSTSNYYAGGSIMPGRNYSSGDYRYGFNGQEKDDEVSGSGNSYTAEFWQYDSRLGRRWNIDPVVKPWESPYAAFANNPIIYRDPNGLDVVNGHKKSKEKASERLNDAEKNMKQFDNMSRKDIRKLGMKKEFKEAKNELQNAQKDYSFEKMAFDKVEQLIKDYKAIDKVAFDEMNTLEDEGENKVNIFVMFGGDMNYGKSDYKGGHTDHNIGSEVVIWSPDGLGESYYTVTSANGENTVVITMDKISNARHLSHEFGHTKYFVKNTKSYRDFLRKNPKAARSGGHFPSTNPSGDAAEAAEEKFKHLPRDPR